MTDHPDRPDHPDVARAQDFVAAPGVWVIYEHDHGPYAESVHPSAEAAARHAATSGGGRIGYWPFAMSLSDAVAAWERAETHAVAYAAAAADWAPTDDDSTATHQASARRRRPTWADED